MEQSTNPEEVNRLAQQLAEAMAARQYAEATTLWSQLTAELPSLQGNPTVPVVIALRDGRPNDALHLLTSYPDDQWLQLRAMCLHAIGDPLWEGYARAAEQSDDQFVRDAMGHLLRKPEEQGA